MVVRQGYPGPLMPSPFTFKKYGQCGMDVSELFPQCRAARRRDRVPAIGVRQIERPRAGPPTRCSPVRSDAAFRAMGSWVTYGLGSENSEPAGLRRDVRPSRRAVRRSGRSGARVPAGGVSGHAVSRRAGDPIVDLKPPAGVTARAAARAARPAREAERASHGDASRQLGSGRAHFIVRAGVTACRDVRPKRVDIDNESEATRSCTGSTTQVTEPFGRQCLMARRLVERGVRFVQLFHGGMGNQYVDTWDAHEGVKDNHTKHAAESDLPIAGLLTDLKARGLLDSTLVIWHGEFGRMPISQRGVGRDHNPGTMTVWMAGAGIKGGQAIGASDEFGYKAEQQPISYHDLHATILHLLGIDHTRLTYRFNGRNMRLDRRVRRADSADRGVTPQPTLRIDDWMNDDRMIRLAIVQSDYRSSIARPSIS